MNLETKITIYKFTPQVFTLTRFIFLKIEYLLISVIDYLANYRVAIKTSIWE